MRLTGRRSLLRETGLMVDGEGPHGDEGRDLLRRPRRAHGRGDAAHPEADDPDRQPADPLAHHALLRRLGAQRVRALPRLQGRRDQASTSSTTTRRCSTTSCSRDTAPSPRWRSCNRDGGAVADHVRRHGHAVDDRRAAEGVSRRISATTRTFMATYGDGLTDAPLARLIDDLPAPREDDHVPLGAARSSTPIVVTTDADGHRARGRGR